MFGSLFVASSLAISDAHPPYPAVDDPSGIAACLVTLALTIRCLRLGITIKPDVVIVRGYFLTRRLVVSDIQSIGVIDYPGPWWLNSERLKGLRLGRRGGRPLTVWGVTGSMTRVNDARRVVRDSLHEFASHHE